MKDVNDKIKRGIMIIINKAEVEMQNHVTCKLRGIIEINER